MERVRAHLGVSRGQFGGLVVGTALVIAGLCLILNGWHGVANTPFLFDQLTYIVSGGILGLAVTVIGGFVCFASWQLKIAADRRRDRVELTALVSMLVESSGATGTNEAHEG